MPKKFKGGENSKAAEARARKEAKRQEEREEKERKLEDEYWRDDDKHVAKKQQRKEDKEKKRLETLEKKKELQKLHDEEMEQLKAPPQASFAKLTRAEIEAYHQKQAAANKPKEPEEEPIPENVNRLVMEGDEAHTVEEAIAVLSVKPTEVEKHPEKRMKAAFQKFEEENLPKLKQQHSNLRLSQIKQILKKEWNKSPDNPMNQRLAAFNMKT